MVRDEPQIYPGSSAGVVGGTEGISTPTEERGDILVRNLWKHPTDCVLDAVPNTVWDFETFKAASPQLLAEIALRLDWLVENEKPGRLLQTK